MHNEPNSRLPGEGQDTAQACETLTTPALARRRALVRGLGKGGAALAVVAPIQSFAVPRLTDNRICSLSGAMSAVNSHAAAGTVCSGYMPTHYYAPNPKFSTIMDPKNWPTSSTYWPTGQTDQTLTFSLIFGGSDGRLVIEIFGSTSTADIDKKFWIATYFNAMLYETAPLYFPYTPSQVQSQYNGTQSAAFLQFYKDYLSTLS